MNGKTIKVLYIEDDPEDVELVKEYLDESIDSKFSMLHVNELSKGIQVLKDNGIDIVLLDLSLPDCIGLETFKKLRANAPLVPIIVFTGTTLHRAEMRECIMGSQSFLLKKDLDSNSLIKSILESIEKRQIQEKLSSHFVDDSKPI